MPLTKRSFKPYCPVTVPGALYLLAAAVLLLLGRIRGELGSALAGLLILAYALFSLAACLAARPFWKRTQFRIEQLPHGRVSLTGTALLHCGSVFCAVHGCMSTFTACIVPGKRTAGRLIFRLAGYKPNTRLLHPIGAYFRPENTWFFTILPRFLIPPRLPPQTPLNGCFPATPSPMPPEASFRVKAAG